jgi:hypothetical protein
MLRISYYNQYNKNWSDDYLFRTHGEASAYLKEKGYREEGGVFVKGDFKAYIMGMKIYDMKTIRLKIK